MRQIILILTIILACTGISAGPVKTVKGEFTFYGDRSHSPESCERHALEGARIAALAKEFGTIVTQDVYQRETVANGDESLYLSSLNSTEVKGEWLEDIGSPKFERSFDADGHMVVKCTIVGKAREISNESVDFLATVLRNGTEHKFADTRFRDGDDMYLLFKTPVEGYVAAYLIGDDRQAYRLLPYSSDRTGEVKVKHDKEYVFFSTGKADRSHGIVDEYTLTADSDIERNQLYVIFSPKPFSKAVDTKHSDTLPPQLDFDDFSRWLSSHRTRDPKMGIKVMHLEISR